jgi:hypothetical protein
MLSKQDSTNRLNANIHALSRIQTHDPSFRASEDDLCLRPRGHSGRQSLINHVISRKQNLWKHSERHSPKIILSFQVKLSIKSVEVKKRRRDNTRVTEVRQILTNNSEHTGLHEGESWFSPLTLLCWVLFKMSWLPSNSKEIFTKKLYNKTAADVYIHWYHKLFKNSGDYKRDTSFSSWKSLTLMTL